MNLCLSGVSDVYFHVAIGNIHSCGAFMDDVHGVLSLLFAPMW